MLRGDEPARSAGVWDASQAVVGFYDRISLGAPFKTRNKETEILRDRFPKAGPRRSAAFSEEEEKLEE